MKFWMAELGTDVEQFTLHLYFALAEKEHKVIGQCSSAALQSKIAAGWQARNPNLQNHLHKSLATDTAKADKFAEIVIPTMRHMLNAGMSRLAIANELNDAGMPTTGSGAWASANVGKILKRAI